MESAWAGVGPGAQRCSRFASAPPRWYDGGDEPQVLGKHYRFRYFTRRNLATTELGARLRTNRD